MTPEKAIARRAVPTLTVAMLGVATVLASAVRPDVAIYLVWPGLLVLGGTVGLVMAGHWLLRLAHRARNRRFVRRQRAEIAERYGRHSADEGRVGATELIARLELELSEQPTVVRPLVLFGGAG